MVAPNSKKKSQIDQIRAKAKLVGFDVDAIITELTDTVVEKIKPMLKPPDVAQIIEQVSMKVEAKVSVELAEVMESVKTVAANPGVNIKEVINGVSEVLKPIIIEQSQKAAETVFQSNSKLLMETINAQLKASQEEARSEPGAEATKKPAGAGISDLLSIILQNADKLKDLVAVFRPAPAPETQIASNIAQIFKWHSLLTKVEKSGGNTDELAKEISATLQPPK